MDDPHKMIAGRQLRGAPYQVKGLLVEAIGLIVNENRYRPEILPALITQTESFPCKAEGCFIPVGGGGMNCLAIQIRIQNHEGCTCMLSRKWESSLLDIYYWYGGSMNQIGKRDRPYALKAGEGWIYRFGIDFTVKSSEVQQGSSAAFLEYATRKGEEPPSHTHG